MTALVLRNVEVAPGRCADVRVEGDRVVAIGAHVPRRPGEPVLAGRGGALLPGIHDHHLHLLATAAARDSVCCGPPDVTDVHGLAAALHAATPGADGWIRGVGYHEQVAGDLDRATLDAVGPEQPIRVQHRSGALWVLNSAGLAAIDAAAGPHPAGLELDADGRATGRLLRADDWLRSRLGRPTPPDLGAVGAALLRAGVTGLTDATPDLGDAARDLLVAATGDGRIPQQLCLLGVDDNPASWAGSRVLVGPRKLVLGDHDLPDLPTLCRWIQDARDTWPGRARPVAVHCVTRVALVLLLAAWDDVGAVPGDRVEHAAIVPDDLLSPLRRHGVVVVTQPGLVAERGDDYLRHVDVEDRPFLYRVAGLLRAGVPVALSSDAPYTDPDPWHAVRSSTRRATPTGAVVGPDERVAVREALAMLAAPLKDPGASRRQVRVEGDADFVVGAVPWASLFADPRAEHVRAVVVGGRIALDQSS